MNLKRTTFLLLFIFIGVAVLFGSYSSWNSANYAEIFMNGKHNLEEAPYWGCLRCHGMFYDGNIKTLLEKPLEKDGAWKLKDVGKVFEPTIPCLACHQVHTENLPLERAVRLDNPREIFYERALRNPSVAWYVRNDNRSVRTDKLMKIAMFSNGKPVKVSDDPVQKLCIQCHSPNFAHLAGSEDDRTPTGVHEGLSCTACHSPHSNDARNSCKNCHPGISNCKLDVITMNTTYADISSPNNIHSVSCNSCHIDKNKEGKYTKKEKTIVQKKNNQL